MNRKGPIIIIEDDTDDQELTEQALVELGYPNEVLFFSNGEDALKYLTHTSIVPFIIFSDINMPKLSGMELRAKIHNNEDLRIKSIPYLFFTTSSEQPHVLEAYSKSVQGFFVKPYSFEKLKHTLKLIIDYWMECVAPNYIK